MFAGLGLGVEWCSEDLPGLGPSIGALDVERSELEEELAHPAEEPAPRPRHVLHARPIPTGAGTRKKTQSRIEPGAELLDQRVDVPKIIGVVDLEAPSGTLTIRTIAATRGSPAADREVLVLVATEGGGAPQHVDTTQRVVAFPLGIAVGDDDTQRQVLVHVVGDASGKEVGPLGQLGLVRRHGERRDPPRPGTTEQLHPTQEGYFLALEQADPSREEGDEIAAGPRTEIEDVRALEEERPFLGKEKRKAGEVDLTGVDLGLGEVRVDGEVTRQIAGEVPGQIATGFTVDGVLVAFIVLLRPNEAIGGDGETEALAQGADAGQAPCPLQIDEGRVKGDAAPAQRGQGSRDVALYVEPPAVLAPLEAKRLCRDTDLRGPTTGRAPGCGVPDPVPIGGHALRPGDKPIEPCCSRIDPEKIAAAPVGDRIHDHFDRVVASHVAVPLHGVDGDSRGVRIMTDKADVDCCFVHQHPNLGGELCWLARVRVLLSEILDRARSLPRGFVERPIQVNLLVG